MIKNTRIDLSKESEDRLDAINSIKYTLLLKYKVPDCGADDMLIANVMDNCYECCRGLMEDYNNPSYDFQFFGRVGSSNKKAILDSLEHGTKKEYEGEIKFHNMILQHCIMSSYHAILTDLLGDKEVTSYEIISRIKALENSADKKDSQGLRYLVRHRKYLLEENEFNKKVRYLLTNEKKSATASDFTRTTETHRKHLKYYSVFGNEGERIPLQFSDLWCRVCSVPVREWKLLGDYKNKLKIIEKLDSSLLKREKDSLKKNKNSEIIIRGFHGERVDGLYTHYLAERMFNFHMIYNMLKHIQYIDANTKYTLSNDETLAVLLLGKKMPNAFSRHCFWGYAIEKIISEPNSSEDYWLFRDIYHSEVGMLSNRRMDTGFQISIWLNQYKLFANYMSEFIIPIYEWCFVGMLLDYIEAKYPEENHRKHLIRLLDLLAKYMEENAGELLCPIEFHSEGDKRNNAHFTEDMSSVLMKHQYTKFEQLNEKTVETMLSNLADSQDDMELNLKKFNPDFFRKDREKQVEYKTYLNTSFGRTQMFYTDLIRYTHLQ